MEKVSSPEVYSDGALHLLGEPEFTTARAEQPAGVQSESSHCWTSEEENLVTLHCHEGSFTIQTFTV